MSQSLEPPIDAVFHQAVGVLQVALGMDAEQCAERLRQAATRAGVSVHDLAKRVVADPADAETVVGRADES